MGNKHQVLPIDFLEQESPTHVTLEVFFLQDLLPRNFFISVSVHTITSSQEEDDEEDKLTKMKCCSKSHFKSLTGGLI